MYIKSSGKARALYVRATASPDVVNQIPQVDSIERYDKGVETRMEGYVAKTTRQKYAKSEVYTKFKHGIYVRMCPISIPRWYSFPFPLQTGGTASRCSYTTYF
jgi:hypothetical protein